MNAKQFLNLIFIVAGIFISGCEYDNFITGPEKSFETKSELVEMNPALKSGATGTIAGCEAECHWMVTKNNTPFGLMTVTNDLTHLRINIVGNSGITFEKVQLWVGTDLNDVPMNKNEIPLPGKFPYKAGKMFEYNFSVKLSDIYLWPEELFGEKQIYIFAHAELLNSTNDELSVWSEGYSFGTMRWGSYSAYFCCLPNGPGCFPYTAVCGIISENNTLYFDNTSDTSQNIVADNGEVIGYVYRDNGNIYFDFSQDWMFTDLLPDPIVQVNGYSELNSEKTLIYNGIPNTDGPNYVTVSSSYPLYEIKINVQHCK